MAGNTDPKLIVSFRGKKVATSLYPGLVVADVKARVASTAGTELALTPSDVKLLCRGKILSENDQDVYGLLVASGTKRDKTYRLMATGVSSTEANAHYQEFQAGLKNAPRIRDDLTPEGRMEIARRQRLGRFMMNRGRKLTPKYGFGRIETLPMLPEQDTARQILTRLANDPGVLACMAKHKWNVGSLAELYPEGKVGESEVCVMGLNKNKGQQILLRIRTDDLKGFRKMLSIRKVLFHELAHNVHSEHNGEFFQLMRQIERECHELDWTRGAGLSNSNEGDHEEGALYSGGVYRLCGGEAARPNVPVRELAARAAMMRLTAGENEIQQHCGCVEMVITVVPTEVVDADLDGDGEAKTMENN